MFLYALASMSGANLYSALSVSVSNRDKGTKFELWPLSVANSTEQVAGPEQDPSRR